MTAHQESREGAAKSVQQASTAVRPASAAKSSCCDRNQALLGNAAVKANALKATGIQPKLKVSTPSDPFEDEADKMADLVVARKVTASSAGKCSTCGDAGSCPKCRAQAKAIHRKAKDSASGEVGAEAERRLETLRGGGESLPDSTRTTMESQFGRSFKGVRVHTGAQANNLASEFSARAFTSGQDIVFAAGEYQPDSLAGERLLAHELTHVAQQGPADEIRRDPDTAFVPTPGNPGPNYYFFQGMQMSADPLAMRNEMRLYVRHFGIQGLDLWFAVLQGRRQTHNIPFSAHARAFGGLRARGPMDMQRDFENDAWANKLAPIAVPLASAYYPVVRQEAVDLLAQFEKMMGSTLELVLGESEMRLKAEGIRYGIKVDSSFWSGVKITAQNNGDFQALAGAAKDLLAMSVGIQKLETEKEKVLALSMYDWDNRDANKQKMAQIDAKIAPLKEEYKLAKSAASLRHPALGASLDETSFSLGETERLEILAKGGTKGTLALDIVHGGLMPTSTSAMLGQVFAARLDAIQTVRAMALGSDRIWSIQPIVSLTMGLMAGEPTGMLRGVVEEKIKQRQFDEALLKSFTLVATLALAIPTGGGSLAVGVAATSLTLSLYQAMESIRKYQFEMALANSDLDKKAYALAQEEPSAFWVALDVVAVFLDAQQMLSAFRAVKGEARAAALAADGADAVASEARLVEMADKVSGVGKSKLGQRLRESLAKLRGKSGSQRALGGAGAHEALAVERAAAAVEKEAKQAETIATIAGHELKVTPSGQLVLCTECKWLRSFYSADLAQNSGLLKRLEELEKKAAAGPLDAAAKSDIKMLTVELEQARKIRVTPGAATSMPKDLEDAAALAPKAPSKDAPIVPGESAKYSETTTKGRGVKGDKLTGDHIPSRAALVDAKQNALWEAEASRLQRPLTPAEKDALLLTDAEKAQINREGLTLVKGEKFHSDWSRTFAGRNRAEQIALDGSDLSKATYADFVTDLKAIEAAGELTRSKVAEYIQHYQNLVSRGVIAYSDDINNLLLAYLKKAKP